MKFSLRQLVEVGIVAAIYVALVHFFAPISFALLQFRLAEFMKSLVIFRKHLIWAMVIGVGISNLASPFAGPWELIWMPLMNLVGGYLTWLLGQRINHYLAALIYSMWLAFAVAFMLSQVLALPLAGLFWPIMLSQAILVVGGLPVVKTIHRRLMQNGR